MHVASDLEVVKQDLLESRIAAAAEWPAVEGRHVSRESFGFPEQRATRMQLCEDEVPDQSMDFIKVGMDHSLLAQIGESHPCSTGGALVQPQNQQPQAMDKGWQY